jgi:DNA processing protein
VLFAVGRLELLERTVLGIVGTRRCTRDGRDFAHDIAHAVVMAGGAVLSGLALGIDGAAHRGALPDTIAVLGAGIDVFQPPSHRELQERIAVEGLLLSEFPPGSEALPFHFPQRNRIIAALSKALLVVEAPGRSGALITAEHASDMGVEVMAVPGPPRRAASIGTNALLRDGATFVVEPRDVLDALGFTPRRATRDEPAPEPVGEPAGIDGDALALWRAAAADPCHIDELAGRAGLEAATSLSALLELEIMGLVRRRPGQRFQRV